MNNVWCESCARKDNCYTSTIKPKCFVALTNMEYDTEIKCPKCGRTDYIREFGKDFSVTAEKAGFRYKCINCYTYIEPL